MSEKVIIVGASDKPDRYSYKALNMLREYGHTPIPIHPRLEEIEGVRVYPTLVEAIKENPVIDTITLYVNYKISTALLADFLSIKPRRVIFNPGAENPELQTNLNQAGVETLEACTLVLLKTGQF